MSILSAACAGAPEPPPAPPVQASQVALSLERRTRLEHPLRLIFDWSLSEPDLRVSGRGVARIEPPDRARLDLFTENGETVVRAALVGDDLRIPVEDGRELIPPPALFWGTLGVFRPGSGATQLGGDRADDAVRLHYRLQGGEELRVIVRGGELEALETLEGGHVVERVRLAEGRSSGVPGEARYRNLSEFRELILRLAEVEVVEPYPPDIWSPGG